jgi:hypothetical protein
MDDEAPQLTMNVSFDTKSGLFLARLDNGARFNFSPANVSGKLGQNLDLLRKYTMRHAKGQPPQPHVSVPDPDEALIAQAIRDGKLQQVGVRSEPDLLDF